MQLQRPMSLFGTHNAGMLPEAFGEGRRTLQRRTKKAQLKPPEKAVHEARIAATRDAQVRKGCGEGLLSDFPQPKSFHKPVDELRLFWSNTGAAPRRPLVCVG